MAGSGLWQRRQPARNGRQQEVPTVDRAKSQISRYQHQMRDVVDVSIKVPTHLREQLYDMADSMGVRPNYLVGTCLAMGFRQMAQQMGYDLSNGGDQAEGVGSNE